MIEGVGGVGPRGRRRLFGLVLRSLEVRVCREIGSGGYLVLYVIRVRVYRQGVGMQDHLRGAIVNSPYSISEVPAGRSERTEIP